MFQETLPNPTEFLKDGGIPKSLLFQSKVDVDHLICPICLNVLWKPVACGQDRCFQSFCEVCINRWIQENLNNEQQQVQEQPMTLFQGSLYSQSLIVPPNQSFPQNNYSQANLDQTDFSSSSEQDQDWNDNNMLEESQFFQQVKISQPSCPKCKRQFKKTSIPIIHNLLDSLQLHCLHEDCEMKPTYEQFYKHILNCPFRRLNCKGCNQVFLQSEIQLHEDNCELVQIECQCCKLMMSRKIYKTQHNQEQCIQQQFQNKDNQILELSKKIQILDMKNQQLESKIDKLVKGSFEYLNNFTFKTSFIQNYSFTSHNHGEVKLIRSSYNHQKQKNDFLHFYINHKVKTQSIVGVQWRVKLNILKGNLLIGICSTLCHYSIDFIINRLGEVKKKEWNENKYKHSRKANFSFGESDILSFQYMPLNQILKITNETRHQSCKFETTELIEMGDSFYNFFSLELEGDQIIFL